MPGQRCLYFEDIQKNGKMIYSSADIVRNRAQQQYNSVCTYKNYRDISDRLDEFNGFSDLKGNLERIRNKLIKEEIAKLHQALKAPSYQHIDPDYFRSVTNDFYEHVVKGTRSELVRLLDRRSHARSDSELSKVQSQIDSKVDQLLSYSQPPYLTDVDKHNMQSFQKKGLLLSLLFVCKLNCHFLIFVC